MIEMCKHYTTSGHPNFRPVCKNGHKASLKCHSTKAKSSCTDYSCSDGHTIDLVVRDEFANWPLDIEGIKKKFPDENSALGSRE